VVRTIMTQLYPLSPAGEPGEDDLGALSSWYVWAALGLYPETPGAADLVMTSPLFPRAQVVEGNGHTLTIIGSHAPSEYIQRAHLAIGSGGSSTWDKPWLPATALGSGATLAVELGDSPDRAWGTAPAAAPPSFARGAAPAVASITPGGSLDLPANGTATTELDVQEATGPGGPVHPVSWHVVPSPGVEGVTVSPASGNLDVVSGRSATPLRVTAGSPGTFAVTIDLTQGDRPLPRLTFDVEVTP
jgi:Glycosyl hydrolase family 92